MASKKTSKKTTKVLTFNKVNAKLFAENIYSDKHGRVSFLKLCEGNLSNGKDGGRTLHCALGEAYYTFVDANVTKFVKSIIKKFSEYTDDVYSDDSEHYYKPKYFDIVVGKTTLHVPTLAVVDALVNVAQLRNNKPDSKKKLANALLDTMKINDDLCGADVTDDLNRSKDVANVWLNHVVPLLK